MRGALAALIIFCALPARADNTADEADIAFQLGNAAYAKKDYEKALAAYFLSNRLVPNKNVLFNIARCYEAIKSFDEAYRYYFDLSTAKDLAADDARDVRNALERLEAKVALVAVTTEPPGADIYIDREDLGSRGRSPATLAIPPGTHKVKVKLEGMHDAEAPFRAGRGSLKKVKLELTPIVGTVDIIGTPRGASVRETENGPELGQLPAKLTFPPGQRLFIVSAPGHTPRQLLVTVKADESKMEQVTLQPLPPPTGKVVITANRENALVRVDGKDSGFTPTVLVLPVGKHEIEVSMKEFRTAVETVDVKADTDQKVVAELRYAAPKVRAASKQLVDVDDAAASITIITREEIQAMGYQTVAEAVAAVRGVQHHQDRIYSYLGIRGFSPPGDLNTRVLILWDGHAINDIWAGQGFAERTLDTDIAEIDRIEIVRGPGSALYGSGAFFAVINVVPRDVVAEDRHVEAIGGGGGLWAAKSHVTASVGSDGPSALVTGSVFKSYGDVFTDLGERGIDHGNDGEEVFSAGVRAKVAGITVSGKINSRLKQIPVAPYGTVVNLAGTSYKDQRGFAELRWEKDFDRLSIAIRGYYDATRYYGTYKYAPEEENQSIIDQHDFGGADWGGAELRARIRLFGQNVLSIGLEGQYQLIAQADSTDGALNIKTFPRALISAYLLDEWRIARALFITLGARVDKYLLFPATDPSMMSGPVPQGDGALAVSPRLGIVARLYERGVTKLVAGTAFRAPNVYESTQNDGNVSQRAVSGTLSPETIYTVELEHSHDFNEELRLSVAGYFNVINNLVILAKDMSPMTADCGIPQGSEFCLVNANSKENIFAAGGEVQLRWQPSRFLFVDVSYSFVRLEKATADIYLLTSQHLFAAKTVVPLLENYVRVSGEARYASPRSGTYVGETFLLDLGFSGTLPHFRYFAGVKNLLDSHTQVPVPTAADFGNVPIYGRTFWLELALSI